MSAATSLVQVPEKADLSVRFSPEQRRIILETCCGGASESEAAALVEIAQARGLNPILGECYFVKRWDSDAERYRWAVQASIDSFRIKAEQTGLYAGQDEPEYEYDAKGYVILARVRVWRKDWPRPTVGVARWDEYVQTTRKGEPTKFWRQMPHNQLAKCAEALALRKAFPAVLAKLYTPEEMAQADNEPAPAAPAARPVALAPAQAPAALPPSPAKAVPKPPTFEHLCERIDAAETVLALNRAGAAAGKMHKDGLLTDEQLERIRVAGTERRAALGGAGAPPAPPGAPESGEVES